MKVKELIKEVNSLGYVAFHYPRLKQVSINGGRCVSEKEAIIRMKGMIESRRIELGVIRARQDGTLNQMVSNGLS